MKQSFCLQILFLCFAVATASTQAATPLVNHDDVWRFHKGNAGPLQPDWKTSTDSSLGATWLEGHGGFGYADNVFETSFCQTILDDMRGNYSTSRTWIVEGVIISSVGLTGNIFTLHFLANAGQSYTVEYRDALDAGHPWKKLTDVPAQGSSSEYAVSDSQAAAAARFYRIVTPRL